VAKVARSDFFSNDTVQLQQHHYQSNRKSKVTGVLEKDGDFPKHTKISHAGTTIVIIYVLFMLNLKKICSMRIFRSRSPLTRSVAASTRYERKCETYFIVVVVLDRQILAGFGKVARKQSLVL